MRLPVARAFFSRAWRRPRDSRRQHPVHQCRSGSFCLESGWTGILRRSAHRRLWFRELEHFRHDAQRSITSTRSGPPLDSSRAAFKPSARHSYVRRRCRSRGVLPMSRGRVWACCQASCFCMSSIFQYSRAQESDQLISAFQRAFRRTEGRSGLKTINGDSAERSRTVGPLFRTGRTFWSSTSTIRVWKRIPSSISVTAMCHCTGQRGWD